jgi:hypothetical protein
MARIADSEIKRLKNEVRIDRLIENSPAGLNEMKPNGAISTSPCDGISRMAPPPTTPLTKAQRGNPGSSQVRAYA